MTKLWDEQETDWLELEYSLTMWKKMKEMKYSRKWLLLNKKYSWTQTVSCSESYYNYIKELLFSTNSPAKLLSESLLLPLVKEKALP